MPSYSPPVDPRPTVVALSVADLASVDCTFAGNKLPMPPSDHCWPPRSLAPPVPLVVAPGAFAPADSHMGPGVGAERPAARLVHRPGPGKRVAVSALLVAPLAMSVVVHHCQS